MSERTMADLYEERILDLQKLHKEIKDSNILRLEDLNRRYTEREKEHKAQMDGILGALGSVTNERDQAQMALAESQKQFEALRADYVHRTQAMEVALRDSEKKLAEARGKK